MGNPGREYENTRHNVGFDTVELLAQQLNFSFKKKRIPAPFEVAEGIVDSKRLILIKPLTFMNDSGRVVCHLLHHYKLPLNRMVVIVDNMDLDPGQCRLKLKGSSAGHNGLKSILLHSGGEDFMRLFIGVGHPGKNGDVIKFVLGKPAQAEREIYHQNFQRAADAVISLIDGDASRIMNELNRRGVEQAN